MNEGFADVSGMAAVPVSQLSNLTNEQRAYLIESWLMVTDPELNRPVPFVPNVMQASILDDLTDNEIIVKWRRAGLTSLFCADAWIDICTKPGVLVELFAHNDRTAREIFADIVLRQYESIPKEFRPYADRSTVNSLVFHDLGSKFIVRTVGQSIRTAEAAGQGRTVNILICTEFAYYAYPEHFFSKIENCVPPGGKIRIDSTPNGLNSFWERFESAMKGQGRFKARFFPWYWSEKCALPLDQDDLGDNISGQGPITDDEDAVGDGNPFADGRRGQDKLTPEQIKWRRWKMNEIKPLGSLTSQDRFRVEFPEDPASCFLHSGRPVFDARTLVPRCKEAEPVEGHEYVIGCDTSTGSSTGHPAGITVIDLTTEPAQQVYEWIGRVPTDTQAEMLVDLQKRYPGLIVVERNYPGDSILQLLRRWGTQSVYRHRERELVEHMGKKNRRKPGFPTTAQTKPRLFTDLSTSLSRGELELSGMHTIGDLKGMQYNDDDRIEYLGHTGADQVRGAQTHGELAIAIALAWHGRKTVGPGVA